MHSPHSKIISSYGEKKEIYCDGKCNLSKGCLKSFEGGDSKPSIPFAYNKWCYRQCDRLKIIDL